MSLIFYEVLTQQPDFTTVPQLGIDDDREVINSAGRAFAAWAGHTDRVMRFDFQTASAEEWRNLREFIDRMGGRAKAFFLPSWQPDFELAEDVTPGAAAMKLAGHWFADNVAAARPDTIGRVLYTINHLGQLGVYTVKSFAEDGPDDVVEIEPPAANAMEAGRTIVGFCYLARLATDSIETEHLSPETAKATLGFRGVTQTRQLDQQETAEGQAIGTLKANFDVIATDEDPMLNELRKATATGPFVLNAPQAENYQSEWVATLDTFTNAVTVRRPTGGDYISPLYASPGVAKQIALAFDAVSREVLAWEHDGQVTIAFSTGSGTDSVTFPGFSPVAYNTFSIDSTVDAGTATLAVFYLRENDATIYCRTGAESFATERRYCKSPLAPLRLFTARRLKGRIELVGMDTGHRLARWRSETYVTPLEMQVAFATIGDLEGDYRSVTIMHQWNETTNGVLAPLEGEYRNTRVIARNNVWPGGRGAVQTMTGTYVSVRIRASASEPGAKGLVSSMTGTYKLVRKLGTVSDAGIRAAPQPLTGTYAP